MLLDFKFKKIQPQMKSILERARSSKGQNII